MIKKIELKRVEYMPKQLEPGILYVAEEFGAAAHLCPCGCGSKIRTPLDATEWSLEDTHEGPSLYPSIGNWQKPCKSHYWIQKGNVVWSGQWSSERIAAGRANEEATREAYYRDMYKQQPNILTRFRAWLKNLFKG